MSRLSKEEKELVQTGRHIQAMIEYRYRTGAKLFDSVREVRDFMYTYYMDWHSNL